VKKFCIAGPINPKRHYFIPHRLDSKHMLSLIEDQEYFVLHAPRQSGKTTAINELTCSLNSGKKYAALYINVEAAQAARDDFLKALVGIVNILAREIERQLPTYKSLAKALRLMAKSEPVSLDLLTEALAFCASSIEKPLVLFIDEIDALIGDTLLSVLRQIRAGFRDRPEAFPQSIGLIGLRDVRDYRIWSREQGVYVSTSSPFNIKAESFTIANFSQDSVQALLNQHTKATGQKFTKEAQELIYERTCGQPWLVNALAYQCCFRDVLDRSSSITKEHVELAQKALILRQDTHIESLIDKLTEERVIPIMDAIISGEGTVSTFKPDDVQYVRDLGLVAQSSFEIANPIYKEIIPRALTWITQDSIQKESVFYKNPDGSLNFSALMQAFTQFFRENSEAWLQGTKYKEAGPHLLMMAFLQRIINGGGEISREYALGHKRVDLFIKWGHQKIVVEIKIRHAQSTLSQGLEQAIQYSDKVGATEAHLVIVDRDSTKTWEEKISCEDVTVQGRKMMVWTL
jgi:hypothetical protein